MSTWKPKLPTHSSIYPTVGLSFCAHRRSWVVPYYVRCVSLPLHGNRNHCVLPSPQPLLFKMEICFNGQIDGGMGKKLFIKNLKNIHLFEKNYISKNGVIWGKFHFIYLVFFSFSWLWVTFVIHKPIKTFPIWKTQQKPQKKKCSSKFKVYSK